MKFCIAVSFSFLSSLRIEFLPEIQFFLILFSAFAFYKYPGKFAFVVISVLCSHHYVIPDALFRFSSENYPSIYTKSYASFKLLDGIVVVCAMYSGRWIPSLKRLIDLRKFPSLLIFFSFFGLLYIDHTRFAFDSFFFIARSVLLTLSVYLIASRLSNFDMISICKLAVVAWISKMLFSIIIPHDNPLYRTIFGFEGIIYFAGDEYLSLGFYAASLILLYSSSGLRPERFFLIGSMLLALILALLAQRKGAVPYFFIVFFLFFLSFRIKSMLWDRFFNFALIINLFAAFVFVSLIVPMLDDLTKLAFLEYSALSQSALSSVLALNPLEFWCGVSAFGKYELLDLPEAFDHSMSFGKEVGQQFRYQLWTIPGGRLILNVGMMGGLYFALYVLYAGIRFSSVVFYQLLGVSSVFYLSSISPVSALAMGVSLSVLVRFLWPVHRP